MMIPTSAMVMPSTHVIYDPVGPSLGLGALGLGRPARPQLCQGTNIWRSAPALERVQCRPRLNK